MLLLGLVVCIININSPVVGCVSAIPLVPLPVRYTSQQREQLAMRMVLQLRVITIHSSVPACCILLLLYL